jgi:hypothetical protein
LEYSALELRKWDVRVGVGTHAVGRLHRLCCSTKGLAEAATDDLRTAHKLRKEDPLDVLLFLAKH